MYIVSIIKYREPFHSVREAVELSGAFSNIAPRSRVVIKPNLVTWNTAADFPKWGVITTSRVIEDVCCLLKDRGVSEIILLEGLYNMDPRIKDPSEDAFSRLGYFALGKRYGLKAVNTFNRPFVKVDLGSFSLNFARDALECDGIVDLPVLKTHAQCMVSLGLKNLKGLIDISSRKKCHSADPEHDLNYHVSQLADKLPPTFTVIDGIYTLERGPAFNGRARRSDIIVASSDLISADKVGSEIIGQGGKSLHILQAAARSGRAPDLTDLEIIGEKLEAVASPHTAEFGYTPDGRLPNPLARAGIEGITYPKYDLSLCTGCSFATGTLQIALINGYPGRPYDDVEILTGKIRRAEPGHKKTVLFGNCIIKANRDNPDINQAIPIKGCPPEPEDICAGMAKAGINVDPAIFANALFGTAMMMGKYEGKPEFSEDYFRVD